MHSSSSKQIKEISVGALEMGRTSCLILTALVLLAFATSAVATAAAVSSDVPDRWERARQPCNGSASTNTIGQCIEEEEEELVMESETSRRILRFIGYGSINPNRPLNPNGPVYHGEPGNSYRRGCNKIYDCRP